MVNRPAAAATVVVVVLVARAAASFRRRRKTNVVRRWQSPCVVASATIGRRCQTRCTMKHKTRLVSRCTSFGLWSRFSARSTCVSSSAPFTLRFAYRTTQRPFRPAKASACEPNPAVRRLCASTDSPGPNACTAIISRNTATPAIYVWTPRTGRYRRPLIYRQRHRPHRSPLINDRWNLRLYSDRPFYLNHAVVVTSACVPPRQQQLRRRRPMQRGFRRGAAPVATTLAAFAAVSAAYP